MAELNANAHQASARLLERESPVDLKAHATHLLGLSRGLMERIVAQLDGPDQWFYQAQPTANFPLWIVGHTALADNQFLAHFRRERGLKPEGYEALFWYGSRHQPRSAYPPVEEVVEYWRGRRQAFLQTIDELSDEELSAPAPRPGARSPIAGAPNIGQLLLFATIHESLHLGQLTVAHRALGYPPLI